MEECPATNYKSYELNKLVRQLEINAQKQQRKKKKSVQQERKYRSCIQINKKMLQTQKKVNFNNKTKEGQLFTRIPPQIPYLFIPKYKNETFIMPDRVFQKGKAGKRLFIKMKDSSIYSFKDSENLNVQKIIHKEQKDRIISGRKMQQLNRIINEADGREKSKKALQHLKTRRIFNPTRTTSDNFSIFNPMLEPKQPQFIQMKKTSLKKTFGPNNWRPASRGQKLSRTSNQFWANKTATTTLQRVCSHRE